jgi:hypothetical protein
LYDAFHRRNLFPHPEIRAKYLTRRCAGRKQWNFFITRDIIVAPRPLRLFNEISEIEFVNLRLLGALKNDFNAIMLIQFDQAVWQKQLLAFCYGYFL